MFLTANITNIAKGSLHDGPGIRTVIYFKGCNLHCQWCHNPETINKSSEIVQAQVKCIHCGKCIKICPSCHIIKNDKLLFHRENCINCGKCADACPTGALSLCGTPKTVDEVFNEIIKDKHYYDISGGGITLSGGECLLQTDFCVELLKKCKNKNIHTTIESACFVNYSQIQKVIPYTDLFYVDLKIANPEKHKKFTGQDNKIIIHNIKKLSNCNIPIIIRIPLIPNVNDDIDEIKAIAKIISSFSNGIKGVELLRYNNLASSKYKSIGKKYNNFSNQTQTDDKMEFIKKTLCSALNNNFNVFFN